MPDSLGGGKRWAGKPFRVMIKSEMPRNKHKNGEADRNYVVVLLKDTK